MSLGLVTGGIVLLLGQFGWLDVLEMKAYDWRVRHSVASPPTDQSRHRARRGSTTRPCVICEFRLRTVAVAALGHRDARRLPQSRAGQSDRHRSGVPRAAAEALVQIGGDSGTTWTGDQSDATLAESVRKAANVVLLADAVYMGVAGGEAQVNAARDVDEPALSSRSGDRGAAARHSAVSVAHRRGICASATTFCPSTRMVRPGACLRSSRNGDNVPAVPGSCRGVEGGWIRTR